MIMVFVFCFKQKTAYEMRISDWSSDVCSSDLGLVGRFGNALDDMAAKIRDLSAVASDIAAASREQAIGLDQVNTAVGQMDETTQRNGAAVEIGRASWRERGWQDVEITVVAVAVQKKKQKMTN